MNKFQKNSFRIFVSFVLSIIYSCSWIEGPADIIEDNIIDNNVNYFVRDSLNIGIRINELPYADDWIKIDCDSFFTYDGKVVVYMNSHIYVDVCDDYSIVEIEWQSDDINNKTIQLVSIGQKQIYWCGSDVAVDSLNVRIVKEIKEDII